MEQNQYLLDILNIIEESVDDAELDVLSSLRDLYAKRCILLEYSDDNIDINEYDIIQEASNDANTTKKDSWFKNAMKAIKTGTEQSIFCFY